jgi:hypothetical protein
MNFTAYYGIVCLYPHWTMRKAVLVRADMTDYQAVYKYRGRGFDMLHRSAELPDYEPSHMCGQHRCCPKAKRELHDDITLCICLEDEGLDVRSEESERVGWVLEKDHDCGIY